MAMDGIWKWVVMLWQDGCGCDRGRGSINDRMRTAISFFFNACSYSLDATLKQVYFYNRSHDWHDAALVGLGDASIHLRRVVASCFDHRSVLTPSCDGSCVSQHVLQFLGSVLLAFLQLLEREAAVANVDDWQASVVCAVEQRLTDIHVVFLAEVDFFCVEQCPCGDHELKTQGTQRHQHADVIQRCMKYEKQNNKTNKQTNTQATECVTELQSPQGRCLELTHDCIHSNCGQPPTHTL